MGQMVKQETEPSGAPGGLAMARINRLLALLKVAEAGLRNLSRGGVASLGVTIATATEELQALQAEARPTELGGLPQVRLERMIEELVTRLRKVQTLLEAARRFYDALLRIHCTERHGYGGLVSVTGARCGIASPHRFEMRG